MKEAYLYKKLVGLKVRCDLCNHRCVIENGNKGICGVRKNTDGVLFSMVYDKVISENVAPIEKKPLFHFLPGSLSLSIAAPGCNFKCFFCQNWQISNVHGDGRVVSAEEFHHIALSLVECGVHNLNFVTPDHFWPHIAALCRRLRAEGVQIPFLFISSG